MSLFTAAGIQHHILTFCLADLVCRFIQSVKLQPDQMETILPKRVGSARLPCIPRASHRRSSTLKLVWFCSWRSCLPSDHLRPSIFKLFKPAPIDTDLFSAIRFYIARLALISECLHVEVAIFDSHYRLVGSCQRAAMQCWNGERRHWSRHVFISCFVLCAEVITARTRSWRVVMLRTSCDEPHCVQWSVSWTCPKTGGRGIDGSQRGSKFLWKTLDLLKAHCSPPPSLLEIMHLGRRTYSVQCLTDQFLPGSGATNLVEMKAKGQPVISEWQGLCMWFVLMRP